MQNNNQARRIHQAIVSEGHARVHTASGPLFFGHSNRPLFGWLHAVSGAPAEIGLIVCNPFGNEAVCAHRSIRYLCERARQAGIPALRFDYDGTGDSAGHDSSPGRIEAWIESVRLAAEELKLRTGVERVCLFGIRLGAMLATLAAMDREDIASLIVFAPVVSGRAYLREMRVLQRAMDAKRNLSREATDHTFETAGFMLSAETQAALGSLDLNKLEGTPAPRILIMDRADLPGDRRWPERLAERGARVDSMKVAGYTEMMLDSHESVVPGEMIETAIRWLGQVATEGSVSSHPDPGPAAAPETSGQARQRVFPSCEPHDPTAGPAPNIPVKECVVQFGEPPTLFGIVTTAHRTAELDSSGDRKAVVLLNSGAVHHIGPSRLHVTLARHLARKGYTVLRMDIAGIGDSPPRPGEPDNVVYSRHALEDVRAAITYLRSTWNIDEVSAIGLCSGAYHSFKAAVAHLPLAAAILINPLTFFYKEGMSLRYPEYRIAADIMRYRTNAFRLEPWLKLLRGRVNLWELTQVLVRGAWRVASQFLRAAARTLRIPLRDDLPSELLSIVRAGIKLEFIFAEREPGLEMLANQGGAVARRLRKRGSLGLQTIAGADHTFTDGACRTMLVVALETALSERRCDEPAA